jgi:hypothetical protein
MRQSDEELQNLIERGQSVESSDDARAYQRVFSVLKHEPTFHVSLPFADRIIGIIDKREEKRDYWWMALGIFLTIIALIVALALTSTQWTTGVFTFLSGYSRLILFAIAFILLLHWIDKKVIKKHLHLR